jgi:hypothetical protein
MVLSLSLVNFVHSVQGGKVQTNKLKCWAWSTDEFVINLLCTDRVGDRKVGWTLPCITLDVEELIYQQYEVIAKGNYLHAKIDLRVYICFMTKTCKHKATIIIPFLPFFSLLSVFSRSHDRRRN